MISGLESISVQRATLIYLVLLSGCSSNTEPKLEQWADGVYQERQVKAYDITGKRDGGTTRAVAIITRENGDRLYLTLKVTYDPKPVLDAGYWRLEGTRVDSGTVHAESLRFLGGQSEGPSLGGRFRLEGNGRPRFRVVLPLRTVEGSVRKLGRNSLP
jgi:hypothetical protein